MNQYLDILAIVSFLFFIIAATRNIDNAILIGVLIKPLIDTAWDVKFIGFSLIDLHSILFVVLGYQIIFKNNLFSIMDKSLTILWVIAHLGVFIILLSKPVDGIESIARMLYFPLGLVLIPYFLLFCDDEMSGKLLKYLIYGAMFSSMTSILQFIGVIPHEFVHASKGLIRSNGFYHDMVTSRIYVMQGLITLAYIRFSGRFEIKSWMSWVFVGVFVLSGYALFSKALIGIFAFAGILMLFFTKQKPIQLILGVLVVALILTTNTAVLESTNQLFVKELEYNEGELDDSGQLFSGRGMLWQDYINYFLKADPLEQIVGLAKNDGRTHNEFIRSMVLSGLIGLVAYTFFILKIFKDSISQYFRRNEMIFIVLFCAVIMIVDSVSVVWGLYPFYLITIVGFYQTAIIQENIIYTDESIDTKIRLW